MTVIDCLPPELRDSEATVTPIAAGMSGAGVYRVDHGDRAYVLKIASPDQPVELWREQRRIREEAAAAGVAPRILHVDELRRAVVSEFVADRGFPMFYRNPTTHSAALTMLATTIRRVHTLSRPTAKTIALPTYFHDAWATLQTDSGVPEFARQFIEELLVSAPPASDRDPVLSHNDVNPSNVVFDGARMLLVDWDTAGENDPFYDLATVALFMRMDRETCRALLAAYDDRPVDDVPARLTYYRRYIAAFAGAMMLSLARRAGHQDDAGDQTLDATSTLVEFYQGLRTGTVDLAAPLGRWTFGLALVKEGLSA